MKKITGDPGSLCLPIKPYTAQTVVYMITAEYNIYSGVHLDSGDLSSAELHHIVDVVDVVVFYDAEDPAHAADDPALLTVMDVISSDYMAPDILLQPAMILPAAYRISLHLRRALHVFSGEVIVVIGIKISTDGDAGALAE